GQALRRASARWRNQAAGPARRRSREPVYPVANGPAVSASIAESVLLLASPPDRLWARRSVILPSDDAASTDARRDPCDRGHGHRAAVLSRPDWHARGSRAAAQHRVRVAVDDLKSLTHLSFAKDCP